MNKIISLMVIWILTAGISGLAGDVALTEQKLQVTLHPESVIKEDHVCLRHISALTGPDELVQKAGELTLGTFTAKGQVLYADRKTILSRLASAGILSRQVELIGAETAEIQRDEKTVPSQQIIDAARAYIDTQLEGQNVCTIQTVGTPPPVVLDDPNSPAELSAQMSRYQIAGAKKVTIAVIQNKVQIAQQEVIFAIRYKVRRAVAQRELLPGTVLGSQDIRIEQVESSVPQSADWKEPFGMTAKRRIPKDARIHPDWISPAAAPVLIKRNQQVLVQLDTGSMYLSAPGQALDEGHLGELIRVKRGQRPDERIIYCIIQADGTVRPQI